MSDGEQTGFSGQLETRWQVRAAALGGQSSPRVQGSEDKQRGHGRAVSSAV
jgi:hypothetical protein